MRENWRGSTGLLVAAVLGVGAAVAGTTPAGAVPVAPSVGAASGCALANGVQHVIGIQFDNVHLRRDTPNVPSDLEQMPQLFNFLKTHGTVLTNSHDVLSHTASNFVANQTGLYPDRTAITQSNSFNYFDPAGATHAASSFAYWTGRVNDFTGTSSDPHYNTQYTADRSKVPNTTNVNTPAPWVPYTRAGCTVGEVGMSNTVLENTGADLATVFGAESPQVQEGTADRAKAAADYVGLAVHCAQAVAVCAHGQPDALPDEPGGYRGYHALFGNTQIAPVISPTGPVRALDGAIIADHKGNPGFPGFDAQTPTNSLGYAAQMLEHGVQVANVYVSDAHTDHGPAATGDFGPGEAGYARQLTAYDTAFGQFLTRLAADGITPENTLFSVTTDEGDHFAGSAPTPPTCTGAPGNYCSYATKSEVTVNLPGLLATQKNNTTPFAIHADPAPALYLRGNPTRTDPAARQLGRDLTSLTVPNPLTGASDKVAYQIADPVEEKILHFLSSDPARTPTLTAFSGEDDYLTGGAANCTKPCVATPGGYAWNHGGTWADMENIWSAYVGPPIAARGLDTSTWTDQVDTRPTLLGLSGLHDDYLGDGRLLTEIAAPAALPAAVRANTAALGELGRVYKQILAPTGPFAHDTLALSTRGITSNTPFDFEYTVTEAGLSLLGDYRDQLAGRIAQTIRGAESHNQPVDPSSAVALTLQAQLLLFITHLVAHP